VRRRVALKIIKPGMDSKQVIARFEAERQALALMDHPNIARVLDAGATDSGRPYFVMELVRGISITDYCSVRRWRPDGPGFQARFERVCVRLFPPREGLRDARNRLPFGGSRVGTMEEGSIRTPGLSGG
jgi:serine/threonine protein kinase